ncbi:hypothetical protein [Mangrovicoccus algicola]|uniref:DUF3329 domain-containing protein n=1 Tax=Mangrovicoccus algicola TaxID=2771008 RepID=A0A8J6Z5B2_9RHOB|nr:hypothetical protein [Mangrovicoccus algicola]MBE3636851.1 hypothetical protein [Mangrovicoccus algicola]
MPDLNHPFFRPLWRRVLITVFCLGWALFEAVAGGPFWAVLTGGLGLWCAWGFFVTFDPRDDP